MGPRAGQDAGEKKMFFVPYLNRFVSPVACAVFIPSDLYSAPSIRDGEAYKMGRNAFCKSMTAFSKFQSAYISTGSSCILSLRSDLR